jgi:hypothetical protein
MKGLIAPCHTTHTNCIRAFALTRCSLPLATSTRALVMPEMHRIFLIDDVVRAIVLEACAGELSRTDRFLIEFTNEKLNLGENVRTVLARTCRVLSEPALDLIWSDPPPWALAQLLPTKTWKLVPDWTVTDDEATKTSVRLCRWLSSKPAVFKRPGLQRFVEWMLWDKRRSRMARMAVSPSGCVGHQC